MYLFIQVHVNIRELKTFGNVFLYRTHTYVRTYICAYIHYMYAAHVRIMRVLYVHTYVGMQLVSVCSVFLCIPYVHACVCCEVCLCMYVHQSL